MNWFKKLFGKEQSFAEQVIQAANKIEADMSNYVHISKLMKAQNTITILKAHNRELSKLIADLQPKGKPGWPKGKPRKQQ